MSTIEFDSTRCVGHALCNATAPQVYQLDDNGYCEPPTQRIDDSSRAAAVEGAGACPEQALTVIDETPFEASQQ